jgi:hypothetical protein
MLDVANIAAYRSANAQHYLDMRERLDGAPPPATLVELGYHWAEVQINTQYLHYVAEHRPEQELRVMLETRERALRELGRSLDVNAS